MTIDEINSALQALNLIEPLIDFEDPGPYKSGHFEALALMYSNESFRSLLKLMYNNAIKSAALRSVSEVDVAFGKAQALTLKKLLIDAKKAYEHTEKLKLAKQPHQSE